MRLTPDRPGTSDAAAAQPAAPPPFPPPDGPWLLRQHRLLTRRHAGWLGRTTAEDLASEAVVRSLTRPPPDGQYGPWLERVFQNLLVDHQRRQGRLQAHNRCLPQPPAPETPEQAAAVIQLRQRLHALWPQLRPEWQQAIQASYFDEDRAQLASDRQLTRVTVRTRLHRALGAVRQALGVVRSWLPLPLGLEMRPLLTALLPGTLAVTAALSPPPPAARDADVVTQPQRAQRTSTIRRARPAAAPTPARPGAQPSAALPAPAPPPISSTVSSTTPAAVPAGRPVAPPARRAPLASEAGDRQAPAGAAQRFDFEDDEVTGDLQRPDGDDIVGPPGRCQHRSLIEIPGSFVSSLARSVENQ